MRSIVPFECPPVFLPQDEADQRGEGLLVRLNNRAWTPGSAAGAGLLRAAEEAGWSCVWRSTLSTVDGFTFTFLLDPPGPPDPSPTVLQEMRALLEEYRVEEEWRSGWGSPPVINGGAHRITRVLGRQGEENGG